MDLKSAIKKIFALKEEQKPKGGISFSISWPLLAALVLVLVCAVGWAFFMGLMVGRGQNPQTSIQTITGMTETEMATEASPPEILEIPSEDGRSANTPPVAAAEAAPVAQRAAAKPSSPMPAPRTAPPRKSDAATQYDYTFQAAAFRSQEEAKKANAALNKNGLRSAVRKSGKVYLVIVSLRGDINDVAGMRKKLKSLKMDKPVQLSKKAVESKKSKRDGRR